MAAEAGDRMIGDPDAIGSDADDVSVDETQAQLQPDRYDGEETTEGVDEALAQLE